MLWPIVLPFKITFWSLTALIGLATIISPAFRWKRGKTFLFSSLLGCLLFVPSCTGIGMIIDAQRFGLFHYSSYEEVNDFRIGRYLPPTARQIELQKYASGHRAMYSISKQELTTYLDGLWKTHGDRSASSRDELDDGELVSIESYRYEFDGLGWQLPERAVKFYSPIQSDGGGADYYFDPEAEMTYHRAGYW